MSKAVLVMNMPESCSKCQFSYEFQGIKKCQLMNVLYKGATGKRSRNYVRADSHWQKQGWNACIDAIERSGRSDRAGSNCNYNKGDT